MPESAPAASSKSKPAPRGKQKLEDGSLTDDPVPVDEEDIRYGLAWAIVAPVRILEQRWKALPESVRTFVTDGIEAIPASLFVLYVAICRVLTIVSVFFLIPLFPIGIIEYKTELFAWSWWLLHLFVTVPWLLMVQFSYRRRGIAKIFGAAFDKYPRLTLDISWKRALPDDAAGQEAPAEPSSETEEVSKTS